MSVLIPLEKQLGDKAVRDFKRDMSNAIDAVLQQHGIVISWGNQDTQRARDTFSKTYTQYFDEHLRARAISNFLATYKNLLVEFPHLAQDGEPT